MTVKERLAAMAEPGYQKFTSSLLPDVKGILGVRMPKLRSMAREIALGDWRAFLGEEAESFEEIMLQGMVIGAAKADIEEILSRAAAFLPKIDNWSVCDGFCASLKITRKHRERVLSFLTPYFSSEREFDARFSAVMLLDYFITPEYIGRVLPILNGIKNEGYYARMAVAWAISICYLKFPAVTLPCLHGNSLDPFTRRMALQKILDSHRLDEAGREEIRKLRDSLAEKGRRPT